MKRIFIRCLTTAFVIPGISAGVAVAQTDMSRFSLAKAVPADAFIAVAARSNSKREFLDQYWGEVHTAFMNSGILTDIQDMIADAIPDEQSEEFESIIESFGGLCKKVEWGKLFKQEMVFAQRFSTPAPGMLYAEGVVLSRLDKKSASANYAALKSVLDEISKFIEAKAGEDIVAVAETNRDDITMSTLGPATMPGIGVSIAVWQDIIVIGYGGSTMIDESIALLRGTSQKPGLVTTARFKAAFAKLPPAEDSIFFFDAQRMLSTMQNVCSMAAQAMAGNAQGPEGAETTGEEANAEPLAWFKLVGTILDDVSIIDSIAAVEWTDGFRVYSETATSLRDGAKSSPLFNVFTHTKGLKDFARHIPKEAETFQASSGVDLVELYDYLAKTVKSNVPGGEAIIAKFDKMQEGWELNVKKDVLALIQGPTVFAHMGKDWTMLVAVTDEKKAESQVDRLLTALNKAFGQENALMISNVQVGEGMKFKQLSHPMMMMMGGMSPPVLGCADGYFMLGSSAQAIKKCLLTAAGKHPNITKSKRWQAEALVPKGAITSISFTDESKMAEELQAGIAGMSMAMGMVGMFAAEAPPEVRGFFTSLPPILAKLGPVVGKMDFYQSYAAYETFDGQTWHSYGVQNYKKPGERRSAEVKQVSAD